LTIVEMTLKRPTPNQLDRRDNDGCGSVYINRPLRVNGTWQGKAHACSQTSGVINAPLSC